MIIDMHMHTAEGSECAESGIMEYLESMEKLRSEGRDIDALVITEHGLFTGSEELDGELFSRFGTLIMRGVEINTDYCHMLIYGLKHEDWDRLDWAGERTLNAREIIDTATQLKGMLAVPAHPFRACPVGGHRDFSGVSIIEVFNGSNNETQDTRAAELAQNLDCRAIGGSDAHQVDELGKCATEFDATVTCMEELVEEMERGRFRAIKRTCNGWLKF